jgi:prolyl oligopeptidase
MIHIERELPWTCTSSLDQHRENRSNSRLTNREPLMNRRALLAAISTTSLGLIALNNPAFAQSSAPSEDPFLWLEEVEGERALNWVRGQNGRSLPVLQGDGRYAKLEEDALAIVRAKDRLTFGGFTNGYVSNFWQDTDHVRGYWRRADFASWRAGRPAWETLLDIDKLAKDEGKNWVYQGSNALDPNDLWNTTMLLSLSNGGKDANVKREWDAKTRSFVAGGFDIPEAKSGVTWYDKDTLLIGTDWGPDTLTESGYPYVVKKLKRGQALADAVEIYRGKVEDVAAGAFRMDDGERFHFFLNRSPTFFTNETFYLSSDDKVTKLDLPDKHSVVGIKDGQFFFTIQTSWTPRGSTTALPTGSLLAAPLASLMATSGPIAVTTIYAPGPREALQSASLAKAGLYVTLTRNVKSEVRLYQKSGASAWRFRPVALPANGVASLSDSGMRQDEAFFAYNDFITPPSIYFSRTPRTRPQVVQAQPARFNAADLEVQQFEATSKDGTKIPYFVVSKKGMTLDGNNPTLLYGYGGFEVSMLPNYAATNGKLWSERGGVYVLANIRGGGEFGPAWHQAGLKGKRQVIYDDFIGVAEDLIARKITSPRRLGIQGGSNGGLLMGVMMVQRPDLFNAVVCQVPLLDMLRYHKLLAGASWVDEYGDPDVAAERPWLETMSPYQNLKKVTPFPEAFFVTSTKDDRVHPGHARKFAAKMESQSMPFLYYENIDGGHSAAANLVEAAKQRALIYTYLTRKLMD